MQDRHTRQTVGWRQAKRGGAPCAAGYLLQRRQHQRDVLGIEQTLGHEGETRARILLHLIIVLINLHRGNLQGRLGEGWGEWRRREERSKREGEEEEKGEMRGEDTERRTVLSK